MAEPEVVQPGRRHAQRVRRAQQPQVRLTAREVDLRCETRCALASPDSPLLSGLHYRPAIPCGPVSPAKPQNLQRVQQASCALALGRTRAMVRMVTGRGRAAGAMAHATAVALPAGSCWLAPFPRFAVAAWTARAAADACGFKVTCSRQLRSRRRARNVCSSRPHARPGKKRQQTTAASWTAPPGRAGAGTSGGHTGRARLVDEVLDHGGLLVSRVALDSLAREDGLLLRLELLVQLPERLQQRSTVKSGKR